MHNQNEAFLHLNDALPADIARRRDMGDLAGALRLIDARLSSGVQPLLACTGIGNTRINHYCLQFLTLLD